MEALEALQGAGGAGRRSEAPAEGRSEAGECALDGSDGASLEALYRRASRAVSVASVFDAACRAAPGADEFSRAAAKFRVALEAARAAVRLVSRASGSELAF